MNSINNKSMSVVIHTYNDEKNIEECINSAKLLSDQIIVIDMHSTDKTIDLAKKLGAAIYFFPKSKYVEPARGFGIEKSQTDWVFLLDTDERITTELSSEIKSAIRNPKFSNYKIPRKNVFGRVKWLKHGGWWPDYLIRLINKKYFKTWPKQIHSTPIIERETGCLQNPIIHYFHGDLKSMVKKTIIFEDIESNLLFKAKKNVETSTFFRKFLGELYRRLIRSFGFLDGEIGIIESIYQAFSKTITYIYLYEKSSLAQASRSLRSLS